MVQEIQVMDGTLMVHTVEVLLPVHLITGALHLTMEVDMVDTIDLLALTTVLTITTEPILPEDLVLLLDQEVQALDLQDLHKEKIIEVKQRKEMRTVRRRRQDLLVEYMTEAAQEAVALDQLVQERRRQDLQDLQRLELPQEEPHLLDQWELVDLQADHQELDLAEDQAVEEANQS